MWFRLTKSYRDLYLWFVVIACIASQAEAAKPSDFSKLCHQVAARVSEETGVPISVLLAIALTETGRKNDGAFNPWPWTVNMEGKGVWFESQKEAYAYTSTHFGNGARSFDVGCFQINYKWHGQHFESLEAMFDPLTNARYAAKHLSDLFTEKGNWIDAAGAYHSRTPKHANRYKKRFSRIREGLDETVLAQLKHDQPAVLSRQNRFPLLKTNTGHASAGSLFAQAEGEDVVPLITSPLRGLF